MSRWRAQWQNKRDKLVAVEHVTVEHTCGTDVATQVVVAEVVAAQVVAVREQGWCTDRLGGRVQVVIFGTDAWSHL